MEGFSYEARGDAGTPMGAYTLREQAFPFHIPGAPPMLNMMAGMFVNSMFKDSMFPGMRSAEHFMAQRQRAGREAAFNMAGKVQGDQSERELVAKAFQKTGMSGDMSAMIANNIQKMGGLNTIVDIAQATGTERLLDLAAPHLGITQGIIGRGVYDAMRNMNGAPLIMGTEYGKAAFGIAGKLTPEALGMRGLGASDIGGLASNLAQRGLLPGRMESLENGEASAATISSIQRSVKSYGKMVSGLKELFGPGKGITQLLIDLDKATQGGLAQMSAPRLDAIVQRARGLQLTHGLPAEQITSMMAYGSQAARQMGLVPSIGAELALESAGIAGQMVKMQGNFFGARSLEELQTKVNRDMLMGQKSRMGQFGGGLLAGVRERARMSGLGHLGLAGAASAMGGSQELVELVDKLERGTGDPAAMLEALSGGNMPALIGMLGSIGMSSSTAANIIQTETRDTQEMSSKYLVPVLAAAQYQDRLKNVQVDVARSIYAKSKDQTRSLDLAMEAMQLVSGIDNPLDAEAGKAALEKFFQEKGFGDSSGNIAADVYSDFMIGLEQNGGKEQVFEARAAAKSAKARELVGTLLSTQDAMLDKSGTLGAALVDVMMAGEGGRKAATTLFGKDAYKNYEKVFDATAEVGKALDKGNAEEIAAAQAKLDDALKGAGVTEGLEAARAATEKAAADAAADKVKNGSTVQIDGDATLYIAGNTKKGDDRDAEPSTKVSSSTERTEVTAIDTTTGARISQTTSTKSSRGWGSAGGEYGNGAGLVA